MSGTPTDLRPGRRPPAPASRGGRVVRALVAASCIASVALPAHAQEPPAEPGSELVVYLMTMGPGEAIWESFGHNAIWIRDQVRGTDIAYNYGMFDFNQPGFVGRLMRGSMLYWMEGFDGPASARYYASADRTVTLQELNMTPAQRAALRDFLEVNALEENRFYEYDPYRDNCSTRVRDALDRALGGQLRGALAGRETGTTYRSETERLTAHAPAAYTGLVLALGEPVDRTLDAWDAGFIPMRLTEHVRNVAVTGADGSPAPLVLSESVLHQAVRPPPPETPPDRLWIYFIAGLAVGGALLLLGSAAQGGGIGAVAFAITGGLWSAAIGIFGLTITALWALTGHTVTYANENILQVNPLPLVLAALLPFVAGGSYRLARPAAWVAGAAAAASVAGLVLQLLPALDQDNGEIIALVLPAHLALALVLSRWPRPGVSPRVDGFDSVWRARAARASGRYR